ncbi:MAG: outer membrane beta-barrel protein [Gammaproteobacteria bacterium]|nr:outer membrane beta-barrel protein [Gammaproteobacteria bacterium]
MTRRLTSGCIALLGLLLATPALAVYNPLNLLQNYQPEVVVSDPYVEMHTGPGRGYPIFYVAGQGDAITLLKQRTDWFKIRLARGAHRTKEGWVHIDQMRHTLDLDGNPIEFVDYGIDSFSGRRWEMGITGGDFEGAAAITTYVGYAVNPYITLQIEASQILGDFSDGSMFGANILMYPFPNWRVSPYFTIGTGIVEIEPQTTIVQAEDRRDEIAHAGVGANIYLSDRFILRFEYKRHTVLTSRDDNEEIDQWKTGFSIFF